MNCREAQPLLQLFVDGELDARQMRGVALHSARCNGCEQDLRFLESCQDAVTEYVTAAVEEVDLGRVWSGIAPRLRHRSTPLGARLWEWWAEVDARSMLRVPAYAGAAAALVLAANVWQGQGTKNGDDSFAQKPTRPLPIRFDNSAVVRSIKSEAAEVAMLREPETNTLVLWVNDEGANPGGRTVGGLR